MSDTLDATPLTNLVSLKGMTTREGSDVKTRNAVTKMTRKGSFDGFLNTFLGKDKAGSSPKAGQPNNMSSSEKQALQSSMNKTVDDEGGIDLEADPEVAAAAEEAAMMIWNLLYGNGMSGLVGTLTAECTSLAKLSLMIQAGAFKPGSLAGAAGGLNRSDLQGAIDSSNASAEMNNAAVLDALDGLLDGLPRSALEQALFNTAGEFGLGFAGGTSAFSAIAGALNAEVTGINTMTSASLMAQLASASRNNSVFSAENAGTVFTSTEIAQRFQEFIEENFDAERLAAALERLAGAGGDGAEEVASAFAEWLTKSGNSGMAKELSSSVNKLVELLAAGSAVLEESAKGRDFEKISQLVQNLEKALQTPGSKSDETIDNAIVAKSETAGWNAPVVKPESRRESHTGQGSEQQTPFSFGQESQAQAVRETQETEHINTMFEQMENIERLAEAMRMARRNGVSNLTMQLAPTELGRVLLKVEARNGVVSAYLKVEKPEAASQLGNSLGQLRDTLKNMGIELGNLEIEYVLRQSLPDDLDGGSHQGGHDGDASESSAGLVRHGDENETPVPVDGTASDKDGPLNLFA